MVKSLDWVQKEIIYWALEDKATEIEFNKNQANHYKEIKKIQKFFKDDGDAEIIWVGKSL